MNITTKTATDPASKQDVKSPGNGPGGNSAEKIRRILVCRPNHRLGNLLLVTPLLQEIQSTFPNAQVDLFVKGNIAPILFRNYSNVRRIILLPKRPLLRPLKYLNGWVAIRRSPYDLVINGVAESSSGRLSALFANGMQRMMGEIDDEIRAVHSDHRHIAKYPVYSLRKRVQELGWKPNQGPVAPLDLRLSAEEIRQGKDTLVKLCKDSRPAVGIYTYATGRKLYDRNWWEEVYRRLRAGYPDVNIIEVLPVQNVSQISFKAPSYYSRDLRQIGSLVANLRAFISADSGMMHLASAAHTRVVGLFKANNIITYAPYNEGSVGINTSEVGMDELLKEIDNAVGFQAKGSEFY